MPDPVKAAVVADPPAAIALLNVHAPLVRATVWETLSLFTNFTVSPAAIVIEVGDGPWFDSVTVFVPAWACGTSTSAVSSTVPTSVASRRPVTVPV